MCKKEISLQIGEYLYLQQQKLTNFTKGNLEHAYGVYVLCSSMMMHYGTIYVMIPFKDTWKEALFISKWFFLNMKKDSNTHTFKYI